MSELKDELAQDSKYESEAFIAKLDADLDRSFPNSQRARRRREEQWAYVEQPHAPGCRDDLEMRKCFEHVFECSWDEGSKMNQLVFAIGYARGKKAHTSS